jgi:hypothetical protein
MKEKWSQYAVYLGGWEKKWHELSPFLLISRADQEDHVHDQCYRKPQPAIPEGHQDHRHIPA